MVGEGPLTHGHSAAARQGHSAAARQGHSAAARQGHSATTRQGHSAAARQGLWMGLGMMELAGIAWHYANELALMALP